MLAVKNLLDALERNEKTETNTDSNDDFDFSQVLGLYTSGNAMSQHKIRYSDGQERCFSFDGLGASEK